MIRVRPDERIFPVMRPATIVFAFAADGMATSDLLQNTQLSASDLTSPEIKVSLNQIITCCRNAASLCRDPFAAYRAGNRFHVSSYGIYGFAILCSPDLRQTMRFSEQYHVLSAPLTEISYGEDGQHAGWTINPIPHPKIDAQLYRFLVELQFGIHVSLNRDTMGPWFMPQEFHVRYKPPHDASLYRERLGCEVRFLQPENRIIWSIAWMNKSPEVGNAATYAAAIKLCDKMIDELHLRTGVSGKVREALFPHLTKRISVEDVAERLHITTRTLRRKLCEENTSFRGLADELRMQVAIKYLRDTRMTVDEIADLLGFSDTAGFRRAFRRWTYRRPLDFKNLCQT